MRSAHFSGLRVIVAASASATLLSLIACSASPSGASPAGQASGVEAGADGDLCHDYCAHLNACDHAKDVLTCEATCDGAMPVTLSSAMKDGVRRCLDAEDCRTLLSGEGVSGCIDTAKASLAPSKTAHDFCDALGGSAARCGGTRDMGECLRAFEIYGDDALTSAIACTTKACDVVVPCLDAALGLPPPPPVDAGAPDAHDAAPKDAGKPSDAGSDADADAGPLCSPAPVTTPSPIKPNRAKQAGSCTDNEISSLYEACYGSAATGQWCTSFRSAHPACSACALSYASDAVVGPIVVHGSWVSLNVPGCIANTDPTRAGQACAVTLASQFGCEEDACEKVCSPDNSFEKFDACEAAAASTICAKYDSDAACKDGMADGGAASGCFLGDTFQARFFPIVAAFCR